MAFAPDQRTIFARALGHPLWITLLSVIPLGLLLFWVFVKRALLHVYPSSVIPQRVRMAFDVMTEGIAVLDREGRVLLANNALHALHADESVDAVGRYLSALPWLAPSLEPNSAKHPWNIAMRERRPITDQAIELDAAAPASRRMAINCAPILDEKGVVRGCLATFDDLTEVHLSNQRLSLALADLQASRNEIERKNQELQHLAAHDMLTGCLTRHAFFERMNKAFDHARIEGTALSYMVLNIDRFKLINDTLGHFVSDRVLREVATRLLASFRGTDIVGRSGDEFFIGMPGCDVREAAIIEETVRQTIVQECEARVPAVAGLAISVNAGLAVLEKTDANLAQLLERAHTALYAAKSPGAERVVTKRDNRVRPPRPHGRAAVGRLKTSASNVTRRNYR
jgi:diguanylate cyclase (GGDEF)-like protein